MKDSARQCGAFLCERRILGKKVGGCCFGMWVLLFGFGGSGERDVGRGDGIGGCGMVWCGFWVIWNGGYGCCLLQARYDSKRAMDEVGGGGGGGGRIEMTRPR